MDEIRIRGGIPLKGTIHVSGAKNAALPLICAALLSDETLVLNNVPELSDIKTLTKLLQNHGASVHSETVSDSRQVRICGRGVNNFEAPYDIVRKMRASVLVLGPLLTRFSRAKVSLPGGCVIGARPVDLHLEALRQLGAEIEIDKGYIIAKASQGLTGTDIIFPVVSVGATENVLMAAVMAKGTTRMMNAAREPEIENLARCLIKMGAHIEGIGSDTLIIEGVSHLNGGEHDVIADRIEAGSFAMAAAATGGNILLKNVGYDLLESVFRTLSQSGVNITSMDDGIAISADEITGTDVITEPYPGFPTDLQAQFMAVMTRANGASMITEAIFENRFMHVPELARMGASINLHGRSAMVRGVAQLTGAPVMATDIRASMSLVIAGLIANGETSISRIYHLDRGYEKPEVKLAACGADIERVSS